MLGRRREQSAAHRRRPGEGELAQPRVGEERPRRVARPRGGEDVEDARRQTGVLEDLREEQRGERGELRGLEDDGAPRRERGPDLAGGHGEREVPRGDEQRRADRAGEDEDPRARVGRGVVPARDAHGLLGEPAQELGAVGHLPLRLGERLAHLQRHEGGEVVRPLDDGSERRHEDLGAGPRRGPRPVPLRAVRGVQRGEGVVGGRVGDVGEQLTGGRVGHRERVTARGGAPGPVDEQPGRDGAEEVGRPGRRPGRVVRCAHPPSEHPSPARGEASPSPCGMPVTRLTLVPTGSSHRCGVRS